MADPIDVAEAVIFGRLNGAVSAPVFEHVGQDTPVPFVMIGEMIDQPMETKGDEDRIISAQISAVTQGEQRRPLTALMAEVRDRLDGLIVEQDGWQLHFAWVRRTLTRHPEQPQTYVGLATFEITALSGA